MKKKIAALALSLCLAATTLIPAMASSEQKKVYINGVEVSTVTAEAREGTATVVPARAMFEAMGCFVEWDPAADPCVTIYNTLGQKLTGFNLGDETLTIGTEEIALVNPISVNPGWVTMIDGFAVARVLGFDVYTEGSDASEGYKNVMFYTDADGNLHYPMNAIIF